jgi:cytochrome d ubiquinol oxidase subunit II
VTATFAYLASLYLVGESTDKELMRFFSRRAFIFNCLVVVLGAAVFYTSWLDGVGLVEDFMANPLSLACLIGATVLFLALWLASSRHHVYLARVLAAGQVTLILLGWYFVHAPRIFVAKGTDISFYQAAAPKATLIQLVIALLVGSIFIFPSLFYLLKVFKSHPGAEDLKPQTKEQL